MSIEKNLQTLADNSERIAVALEGILAAANNSDRVTAAPTTTGAEPSGVTSTKSDSEAAEKAEKAAAAKAEKAAAAKAEKAAKEQAAKDAEKTKSTATDAVSYDSIKAVVTELAGKGPDGITAIKGVLKGYGAAKASDVPEEKWAELLADFEKAKAEMEGGEENFA